MYINWFNKILPFLLFVCCYGASVYAQSDANSTRDTIAITGTVNGLDTGVLTLRYWDRHVNELTDTVHVSNGRFRYQLEVDQGSHPKEPIEVEFVLGNTINEIIDNRDSRLVILSLEPGEMAVFLERDDFKSFHVSGSSIEDDKSVLNTKKKDIIQRNHELNEAYDKVEEDYADGIIDMDIYTARLDTIIAGFDQLIVKMSPIDSLFIQSRPDSFYSLYLLRDYYFGKVWSKEVSREFFQNLANHIRTSTLGIYVAWAMQRDEESQVGQLVPPFNTQMHNGVPLSIMDYRHDKVVLLDFWASYCIPCREAIPNLKKIYGEYHDQGFEIIGISADRNEDSWLRAIQQDGTTWPQVLSASENGDYLESINERFRVIGIPQYILIDKSGRIAGRYATLEEKLDDGLSVVEKIRELLD